MTVTPISAALTAVMTGSTSKSRLWFEEVPEDTDLHEKLGGDLFALLDRYGKVPSPKMRINVLESVLLDYAAELTEGPRSDFGDEIQGILLVTSKWPKSAIERLRKSLARRD